METLEESIIERIVKASRRMDEGPLRLGIGDDTAILRPPGRGRELLLTTDQIIENTHFIRDQHPPGALGHKTLARGLSDLAAMGGRPVCFLLSLCLPAWARQSWLKHYIYGMFRFATGQRVPCAGGDVARGEIFCAGITVVGSVPERQALRRDRARPGDLLFVSGRLGGSAVGFSKLQEGVVRGAAARKHLFPEPRLALGAFLRERLKATAAMDLSDGLSMDLTRLARASGVGAEIDAEAVPVFRGATTQQALHGGEEYELLFTVRPGQRVPTTFGGLPLTCIGTMNKSKGITLRSRQGIAELQPEGFQHFE